MTTRQLPPPVDEPPLDPDYDTARLNGHTSEAQPSPDVEAERAVLGALILDPGLAPTATLEIAGTDFADHRHQVIWDAIHAVNQNLTGDLRLDSTMLADHLATQTTSRGRNQLGYIGGLAYLTTCTDACPIPGNLPYYAAKVRDAARLRTIRDLGTSLTQIAATGDPDKPDRVEQALTTAYEKLDTAAARIGPLTPTDATPNTWAPLDLGPVLAGGEIDPPPTMLARTDGNHLLYDHAVHSISGEPTSGKTWFALLACKQELAAGHTVAMLDFEDRASRVVGRLLALGAHPDAVRERFRYVRPHTALDDTGRAALQPAIHDTSLVIVDGVTEAMTLHALDLSSNTDVATFLELLPRWIADHGPAVLLIDHVVKDTEKQGRWAIGGQHKLAGLDGVAYTIKAIEQFGRGKIGHARITAGKDRAGHVEEFLLGRTAGELWLDARNDIALTAEIRPAQEAPKDDAGNMRPTILMERVSRWLEITPNASRRSISESVTGKVTYVRRALDRLIQEGYVEVIDGPNRTQHHRVTTPFRNDPEQDELS